MGKSCDHFGTVWGRLGPPRRPLGRVLGGLGWFLGRLDVVRGASWGVLGGLLGVLTSSGAHLGTVLRRLVGGLGAPWEAMPENDRSDRLPLTEFGPKMVTRHSQDVLRRLQRLQDARRHHFSCFPPFVLYSILL